jgi:SpoVK/Ycf46/Vps4 family AAA+-type ATPase
MDDLARLEELLLQKQGLVIINSHEEQRVLSMLERFALLNGRQVTTWSVTGGLREGSGRKSVYNTDQIPDALRHILTSPDNSVYVFFDAHHFLTEPTVIRLLKDILALDSGRMLVMIAPGIELPEDLKKIAAVLEPKLPSKERVFQILKEEAAKWADRSGQKVSGSRESISLLTQHLSGLTESDVRKLCRMSIHDDGAITAADIGRVLRHKHQMMESAELLTLETNVPKLEEIGGLNRLKQWLGIRREVFIDPANSPGLPSPKGVLLLGVQGAGKSLAAKCVAGSWHLPLFRLDFGQLYGKYHGESESNLRNALNIARTIAPCVLWMDEIEKGLATDSGDGDGGVSRRMLATLLTWMNERKEPVFIVATANDIASLPPELMRKGRFDEIFFVDLPDDDARRQIHSIHLAKRKIESSLFDIGRLAELTKGYSGAEIEQAIVAAGFLAHADKRPLQQSDVEKAISDTQPLSVVMAEQIAALRAWAGSRTVPAN